MNQATALRRLQRGCAKLKENEPHYEKLKRYREGEHDKPFVPPGVSQEYMQLRDYAQANMLNLIADAPLQRLRVEGYVSHAGDSEKDAAFWKDSWQFNRMDARQKIINGDAYWYGRGIASVSARKGNKARPRISVESPNQVHIEMDPEDRFKPLYAVKVITDNSEQSPQHEGLHLVDGGRYQPHAMQRAWVYDDKSWCEYVRQGAAGMWEFVRRGRHTLGSVPFVPFDLNLDSEGTPHSMMLPLIPAQDAVNFTRFAGLLALQFSAYRQRMVTGYDPVRYDATGQPIWKEDKNGVPLFDKAGQKIPELEDLGRMGVDRLLTFRHPDAKIWDVQESTMENYIKYFDSLVQDLFARGQVPPQYQLSNLHNLTGDALTGAESTLTSLVSHLQTQLADAYEQVLRLCYRARGEDIDDMSSEVTWGDGETRSFAQVVDAITKLISSGFPRQAAFNMIPGATPQKVSSWMKLRDKELRETFDAIEAEAA